MKILKSKKLENVCYDIRGPVLAEAARLEKEGHKIIKLNIGNPGAFEFDTPDEIVHDIITNIRQAQPYCDSKGLFTARKAVMQLCQRKNIPNVDVEDIYIGNGVSELITMSVHGLLNDKDELLIPSPDYPLWTAAVNLAGGRPVHYLCDENSAWNPDISDIKKKITDRTKGIVVINPNNPTGAVYPYEILESIVKIAEENELIIFADEIYDRIVYDGVKHIPLGSISEDVLCLTFGGLSKDYRAAGFRGGWLIISGPKEDALDYIEGLNILSSMRLCSNVLAQLGIQTALGGYQSIDDLVKPGGRLYEQREIAYKLITEIPGISCVKPYGAFYLFPKVDQKRFNIQDDEKMILDLLIKEKVLVVQGRGFNWHSPDHFRIVFLPSDVILKEAMFRIKRFFESYRQ